MFMMILSIFLTILLILEDKRLNGILNNNKFEEIKKEDIEKEYSKLSSEDHKIEVDVNEKNDLYKV